MDAQRVSGGEGNESSIGGPGRELGTFDADGQGDGFAARKGKHPEFIVFRLPIPCEKGNPFAVGRYDRTTRSEIRPFDANGFGAVGFESKDRRAQQICTTAENGPRGTDASPAEIGFAAQDAPEIPGHGIDGEDVVGTVPPDRRQSRSGGIECGILETEQGSGDVRPPFRSDPHQVTVNRSHERAP